MRHRTKLSLCAAVLGLALLPSRATAQPVDGEATLVQQSEGHPQRLETSLTGAQTDVFKYFAPEPGAARTVYVRFAIKDEEGTTTTSQRPYHLGIDGHFHRMPTSAIPLRVGRYSVQLIGPDGHRFAGVLDLKREGEEITSFVTIPVMSQVTTGDLDILAADSENRADPLMARTQIKPHAGQAPVTVAELKLGSRRDLVNISLDRTRSLELCWDSPLIGLLHRWDAASQKWVPCPTRVSVDVDGGDVYFRVCALQDVGMGLAPIYVMLRPGDIGDYISTAVTSARLSWTEETWRKINSGTVSRFTAECQPPEVPRSAAPVRLYEAVIGSRAPSEAMRNAEKSQQLPGVSKER